LLHNGKEQREFQIVKDFLERSLLPFCKEMKWEGQDRILKAAHVQHIHNRLHAILSGEISDAALIDALHPTPALGGNPRKKAMGLLEQIEPFDRGWYGGLVGVIGPQGANLHVAIRSALIRESTVHLFAGTGIVEGSDAEQEWEELEQKIRPFTELFV
jgi:menaquinone-specific isochorismate synthase